MLDVGDREADRPGRAGAEQDHRDRDQEEHADQGADEGAGRDLLERVGGDLEERAGGERDQRQQGRRREDRQAEPAQVRVAVAQPPAEPVADRERDQDHPDRVRPDDRRGAEEGRHQPGGRDLGAEAGGADDEDEDEEEALVAAQRSVRRLAQPLLEPRSLPGGHGAAGAGLAQWNALGLGEVEQPLALGVLLRPA